MTNTATAIRIGRKRANDGLALHLSIDGSTCRSDIHVHDDARTACAPGVKLCKRCFTPKRIAKAQTVNNASSTWSVFADKFLANLGPQVTVADILARPGHAEEVAEIAARHAAFWAETSVEVVPEPVKKVSGLGRFAADLGVRANASQPHPITRKSQKRRLALANSFSRAV